MVLVAMILFMFLWNVRTALIVAINVPLALLFAFAALVLRGDGKFEVWLPHIHGDPPPNALAMSALICAYHDERIMAMIKDAMDAAGYEYLDPPPPSLTPAGERADTH